MLFIYAQVIELRYENLDEPNYERESGEEGEEKNQVFMMSRCYLRSLDTDIRKYLLQESQPTDQGVGTSSFSQIASGTF